MTKEAITQGYNLERLAKAQDYTQANMRLGNELGINTLNKQYELNQKGADAQLAREKVMKLFTSDVNVKEYARKTGIDLDKWMDEQDYLRKFKEKKPDLVDTFITEGIKIGQLNGLEGDQLTAFTARYVGAAVDKARLREEKGTAKTGGDTDTSGKKGNYAQEVNSLTNAIKEINEEITSKRI